MFARRGFIWYGFGIAMLTTPHSTKILLQHSFKRYKLHFLVSSGHSILFLNQPTLHSCKLLNRMHRLIFLISRLPYQISSIHSSANLYTATRPSLYPINIHLLSKSLSNLLLTRFLLIPLLYSTSLRSFNA